MKVCILQPPYSRDTAFCDEYFAWKLARLDECDESLDMIVLPEYSDVPCVTADMEETLFYHNKYMDALMEKCVATAKRCHALVFVNALDNEYGWRNTTFAIETLKLDSGYTFEPSEPYILEIEGLRYAFLTCYDFYFYESFSAIARQNVDIIIGCSLQRSDTHAASEVMSRFLAYNTNAYVVRASVSFGEDSPVCANSIRKLYETRSERDRPGKWFCILGFEKREFKYLFLVGW